MEDRYLDFVDSCSLDVLIIPVCALSYLAWRILRPLSMMDRIYLPTAAFQLAIIIREIVFLHNADLGVGFLPLVPIAVFWAASLRIMNRSIEYQVWEVLNVMLWAALAVTQLLKLESIHLEYTALKSEGLPNTSWISNVMLFDRTWGRYRIEEQGVYVALMAILYLFLIVLELFYFS